MVGLLKPPGAEAEATGAEPTVSPTCAHATPGLRASKKPRGRGRGLVEAKDGGAFGLSEGPPKREGTSGSMFTENGCWKKKHFTIRDILTKRKT